MPKKQQQSEFYFFMVDKKSEVERREGRIVSMAELPGLIYQEWKMLPESKKEKYKKMKDRHRETNEKMDCRGVPLREIEAREQERKLRESEMSSEIILTIETLKHGNALERGKFFLVSTNVYVVTEEMQYVPAEVSILQFGLQSGIMEEHHIIIPPKIPLGYPYEAQVHSDKTHNLMDENNIAATDGNVGLSIFDFILKSGNIKEGQKLPPLYTLEEQLPQTVEIFRVLLPEQELRIYSLDELFLNMYGAVFPDTPIPKSISHMRLTSCGLDYHPTIACEWHIQYQSDAGKYCSLSCVRRWVFHICDNLKLEESFGIVAEEGKHLPRQQVNTGTVVDIPRPNLQDECMSRRSSRDVSRASSTHDVFSFTQSKKAIAEIKPAHAPAVMKPAPAPAASAWGRSANVASKKTSYGTAAGAVTNAKPDTGCDDEFPALGARPTRGRGKNLRGNI